MLRLEKKKNLKIKQSKHHSLQRTKSPGKKGIVPIIVTTISGIQSHKMISDQSRKPEVVIIGRTKRTLKDVLVLISGTCDYHRQDFEDVISVGP